MSVLLSSGVRVEVMQFFAPHFTLAPDSEFLFPFTSGEERFGPTGHRMADCQGFWQAGADNLSLVRQVFFTCSAVEAVAFLNLNFHWFGSLDQLLFIATGPHPDSGGIAQIAQGLPGRKFGLILSNDLLSKVWSVKMAGWLFNVDFSVASLDGDKISVCCKNKETSFPEAGFNLNAVQLSFGFRLGIKTYLPRTGHSFSDEFMDHLRGG
jgi:hypothetical protein